MANKKYTTELKGEVEALEKRIRELEKEVQKEKLMKEAYKITIGIAERDRVVQKRGS